MAGLLDIAPAAKRVLIPSDGKDIPVDVRGLTIEDIRDMMVTYPDAMGMLDTGFDVATVMAQGPKFLASVIAMACGAGNNPDAEKIASELPLGIQAEIIGHAMTLTMPRGVGPFKELLKKAGLTLKSPGGGDTSAAKSPKPSQNSASPDMPSAM